jgi:hypothetical protein
VLAWFFEIEVLLSLEDLMASIVVSHNNIFVPHFHSLYTGRDTIRHGFVRRKMFGVTHVGYCVINVVKDTAVEHEAEMPCLVSTLWLCTLTVVQGV